ncbi:MAG: hypothetical protein Q9216_003650 [Gyalolechia sp. 2 TL-2023]
MASEPYPSPPPSPDVTKIDPVLRNALRYTISAKEYKTLHEYLITRSPQALRKRAPPPAKADSIARVSDDHNAATVRASFRVFIASQTGLQIWDFITTRLFARGETPSADPKRTPRRSRGQNPTQSSTAWRKCLASTGHHSSPQSSSPTTLRLYLLPSPPSPQSPPPLIPPSHTSPAPSSTPPTLPAPRPSSPTSSPPSLPSPNSSPSSSPSSPSPAISPTSPPPSQSSTPSPNASCA